MAVTELVEPLRPVIREAIECAAMGEDITWDVTWTLIPTPNGPQTAYLCYLHCAALHTLGAILQRVFNIPIGASPEVVQRLIGEQLRELFTERSRLLNQSPSNNGTLNGPRIVSPGT